MRFAARFDDQAPSWRASYHQRLRSGSGEARTAATSAPSFTVDAAAKRVSASKPA